MEIWNGLGGSTQLVIAAFACLMLLVIGVHIYHLLRDRKLLRSVTSRKRGTASERNLVLRLRQAGYPAVTIYHDLCIEKRIGKFSQVDVVLVTSEGIVVFEVKDYAGWIYGSGSSTMWTKVLNYGKIKNRFYNPIKQNLGHIKALKALHSQFKYVPFYSVIVFYGDCELKEINYVPRGTYIAKANRVFDVLREIKTENGAARYADKRAVVTAFQAAVETGANTSYQERHIANIKDAVGKHRIFE